MTPRVKSTIILIATLLIGIVLGALLHARLVERRVDRLAFFRTQRGFVRGLERMIEYESPEQREAVRAILDSTAQRIDVHFRQTRGEMHSILDSLRTQLGTVLTDQQMERLTRRLEMHRPEGRQRRRGPPR